MNNLTRLKTETDTTLTMVNKVLTSLAIESGYAQLYQLKDKRMADRTLLFLYAKALQIWLNHDGTEDFLCEASVRKLLLKVVSIYASYDCEEIAEIPVTVNTNNIFGGSYALLPNQSSDSTITVTIAQEPPGIFVTGDQLVSNGYSHSAFAKYDLTIYYNGFKFLKKGTDYTVRASGGFDLLDGTYSAADEFFVQPNGLL